MDFQFKTVSSVKELNSLRDFLLPLPLEYPEYEKWVIQTCIPEIELGYKQAILAFSNGYLIGDAIHQPHKQLPNTTEFKNLRIHPRYRRRDIGHFLLRQVEEESKAKRIILDVDSKQTAIICFLEFCGYRKIAGVNLYSPKSLDYVMIKERFI